MAFTPKDWRDSPDTTTPLDAAALEDLETRVTNYVNPHASTHADGGSDEITSALDPRAYPTLIATVATKPAAGVAGRRCFVTDDNGGTEYLDDGTQWIPLDIAGREIAYAYNGSVFNYNVDNNPAAVTGVTITFTPVQAAVDIVAGVARMVASTTAMVPVLYIGDAAGTAQPGGSVAAQVVTGALSVPVGVIKTRLTLTPGVSVTYKMWVVRGLAGASSIQVVAGSWIQAIYR